MNQITESSIVQDLSPQFEMNSETEEICPNMVMLSKLETVCICISYHQVHILLNLISDYRRKWYRMVQIRRNRTYA
jgi:hypothetical protein